MTSLQTKNGSKNEIISEWSPTNNGYIRTEPSNLITNQLNNKNSQNQKNCIKTSNVMDEVTGALLGDTPHTNEMNPTTDTISATTPLNNTTTNGPITVGTNTGGGASSKTTIVHFGPGPKITTTSLEPSNLFYKDVRLNRRLIILVVGFALLGAGIGVLTTYFARSQMCATGKKKEKLTFF